MVSIMSEWYLLLCENNQRIWLNQKFRERFSGERVWRSRWNKFNEERKENYSQKRIVRCEVTVPQSCLTLCNPMDCNLTGSSVHGILQARILVWVAISFSRDLPKPWIEPRSPALQADSILPEPPEKP